MNKSIHGHKVIELVQSSASPLTQDELLRCIEQTFGAQCLFHTCKQKDLSALQLIEFFIQRGKLTTVEGGFVIDPSKVCNH